MPTVEAAGRQAQGCRAAGDQGSPQGASPLGQLSVGDNGDRHQVKRIIVKPGSRLSLRKHHHRSEHWIVVRGAAKVVKTVHENESVYIPMGAVHRVENPGKICSN
jgi:mannose-1-phosphate guanylyltransferase/mannose-6-phosphate isomerase